MVVFAACGRDLRKPPPVREWCDRRRLFYLYGREEPRHEIERAGAESRIEGDCFRDAFAMPSACGHACAESNRSDSGNRDILSIRRSRSHCPQGCSSVACLTDSCREREAGHGRLRKCHRRGPLAFCRRSDVYLVRRFHWRVVLFYRGK